MRALLLLNSLHGSLAGGLRRNGVFPVYSERLLFADFDKNVRRAGMESEPLRSAARIGSKFAQLDWVSWRESKPQKGSRHAGCRTAVSNGHGRWLYVQSSKVLECETLPLSHSLGRDFFRCVYNTLGRRFSSILFLICMRRACADVPGSFQTLQSQWCNCIGAA